MASIQDNVLNLTSLVEKLNKELDSHVDKLELGAQAVQKYNKEFAKTPSEYVKVLSTAKQRVDELDKSTSKMVMTSKQMEAQSIKESNARNALNKQRETSIKQMEREQARLEASQSLYNKVQAKMNGLSNEYKNLATRKELGIALTDKEVNRYDFLQRKIQTYDKTLKGVDASMGKYSRNVGNYAGNFNPLNNSINQLGREMPAFANSVQTGFMAISNNLPIFFDAMGNVIAQNKELQAQGQPTKSVLSQLAGALFSFQTLLSVGVTLLTVYGKEIVNWVSSLWGASDALGELNKSQEAFKKSSVEGRKEAVSDKTELDKYVKTMTNVNLSLDERGIALKKLRSQYPFYFKSLTDEQMLNGNITEKLKELNTALDRRGILNKATEANESNKKRLIDLKNELKITKELEVVQKNKYDALNKEPKINDRATAQAQRNKIVDIENAYNSTLAKRKQLETDILEHEKAITHNRGIENLLKGKTIALEYTEEKQGREKESRLIRLKTLEQELADVQSSEYQYRKTILENLRDNNKKVADDEKESLSDRVDAYNVYLEQKRQLAQLENNRNLELIDKEFTEGTAEINNKYKERLQEIKDAENDKNKIYVNGATDRALALEIKENEITAFNKKIAIDRNLITEKFVQGQKDLADEYANEVAYKLIQAFEKIDAQNEISQQKLDALSNRNATGGTLDYSTPLSSFKKYYDDRAKIEEYARVKSLNLDINLKNKRLIELGLANKTESEEYKKLTAEKIAAELELQGIKDANTDKELEKIKATKLAMNEYFNGFATDLVSGLGMKSLNMFTSIEANGMTTFENLLAKAKATGREFQFMFSVVSEVAQDVFNKINEISQANFEAEYDRLDKQTENAIEFAGKNEKAKERIQQQADNKRREIQKREWKAKQQLALVNIVIDTAQAIATTYGQMGWIGGTAGAVFLGAMGAAQLALVASQKMPAFWKGTQNAPEGFALVDELRPEVHTDKSGNIKSLGSSKGANVRYLERGDKIYKSHSDYINQELFKNGINPMGSFMNFTLPTEIKGNDFSEVKQEISKLADVILNKEAVSINIDEAGFRTKIGGAEVLNSRQKFIKRSV